MKNITLAIDAALHRKAKILAAQHDMSMSKLVASCLETMLDDLEQADKIAGEDAPLPAESLVKEQAMPFSHQIDKSLASVDASAAPSSLVMAGPDGQPYQADGQWVWTIDGKPRQPGALRGQLVMADDFDGWPDDIMASFADWPYDDAPSS